MWVHLASIDGWALIQIESFLSPSLSKISRPIEGTVTLADVAFYFMPGAEQWYHIQIKIVQHRPVFLAT
jgi:hypothetical protein